jgi:hypothetical protein
MRQHMPQVPDHRFVDCAAHQPSSITQSNKIQRAGLPAWTGSWTGASDNPSAASAISAITRVSRAASVPGAGDRTSHNPPVVGSSPTRPTCDFIRIPGQVVDRVVNVTAGTPSEHIEQLPNGS